MQKVSRWRGLNLVAALGIALSLLSLPTPTPSTAAVHIADLPPDFVGEPIITGNFVLDQPTSVTWSADGRMFIAQKEGTVKVWQNGSILPDYFIDIKDEVANSSDRGLLAIQLDPDFLGSRPYMYMFYVYDPPGVAPDPNEGARVSRLVRVTADVNQNRNVAVPGSEIVLLGKNSIRENIGNENIYTDYDHPSCQTGDYTSEFILDCIPADSNTHAGAGLEFAPDGTLFVTVGDGGGFGGVDPRALRSQNLNSLAGKILRINPDTGEGFPSNPFYNGDVTSTQSKIYNYGMRNPFRFTLKPDPTNTDEPYKPYVGDVGDGTWEELNAGRGKNFGWPCFEGGSGVSLEQPLYYFGDARTSAVCKAINKNAVQPAMFAFQHYVPLGAPSGTIPQGSIIAGPVFSGTAYPAEYRGALFFADYVHDWIHYLKFDNIGNVTGVFTFATDLSTSGGPVQLSQGPDGNLYYLAYDWNGASGVFRIRYTAGANNAPTARLQADKVYGADNPLVVNFTGSGSTDPDGQNLTFSWAFGDGVTSSQPNPTHSYGLGTYTATLTVTDPFGLSNSTSVRIDAGNTPPVPSIVVTLPGGASKFKIGDLVTFSGSVTDAEDGAIPVSSYQWRGFLFHGTHVHPNIINNAGVNNGTIVIPQHDDNSYYEVCLEAKDSKGLKGITCGDALPETVKYTFNTNPPGLQISYGIDAPRYYNTPVTLDTIVGSMASIFAPEPQLGFDFTSWSNGSSRFFTTTVGSTARTFTATFTAPPPVAVITATPSSGAAPLLVQFDGTGSTVNGVAGAIQSYLWDFGDGLTSTLASPLHVYAVPGNYNASLTVFNLSNLSGSTGKVINVGDPSPSTDLPKPWTYNYIGTGTSLSAATGVVNDQYVLCSSGIDLYGPTDEIGFISRNMVGDGEMIARLISLDAVPDYGAKAGLMIRETIAANSKYMDQLQTNQFGHRVEVRTQTALTQTQIGYAGAFGVPTWMRLKRAGNQLTAYTSNDGSAWTAIDGGAASIPMTGTVKAGFVVTSVDATRRTCARFDNVRFTDESQILFFLPTVMK